MRRERNRQRGHAVLEFALSWTLVTFLFINVYQFGYTFYVYNALLTQTSGAAELASKMTYDVSNASAFTTALQNFVVYGDTAQGTTPIVPGLGTSNVNVTVAMFTGSNGEQTPSDITITISNYRVPTIFQTFTFAAKPRATTAYFGNVICSGC